MFGVEFQGTDYKLLVLPCFLVAGLILSGGVDVLPWARSVLCLGSHDVT